MMSRSRQLRSFTDQEGAICTSTTGGEGAKHRLLLKERSLRIMHCGKCTRTRSRLRGCPLLRTSGSASFRDRPTSSRIAESRHWSKLLYIVMFTLGAHRNAVLWLRYLEILRLESKMAATISGTPQYQVRHIFGCEPNLRFGRKTSTSWR